MARLLDLYRHTDPALARALEERMGLAAIARAGGMDDAMTPPKAGQPRPAGGAAQVKAYFAEAAGAAAKFMARPDGPRIGALAFDGWDTHADEGALNGRLAILLGALDGALAAIETGMGEAWREAVVAIVTEFGRTARINGTDGTDHGTATVALLAGGAREGRPRDRRLAGAEATARRPRPQADHRPARRTQGRAARPPAGRRQCARRHRVSRQRRGEADGRARRLKRLAQVLHRAFTVS